MSARATVPLRKQNFPLIPDTINQFAERRPGQLETVGKAASNSRTIERECPLLWRTRIHGLFPNVTDTKTEALPSWHLETFEPLGSGDCAVLGAFLANQNGQGETALRSAVMNWKLFDNEVRPGFASAMVTDDTGQVVSTCTATPKRLWVDGSEQPWAEIGDTFTDERFQRKGMFAALVNSSRSRAQAAGFTIVYGLPNAQSAPGYLKKLEFAVKENAGLLSCSLPLSSTAVVSKLEERIPASVRGILLRPRVANLSRAVARILLWRPHVVDVRVTEEKRVTTEFDGLWQQARNGIPLGQVRDQRYLEWRYVRHPLPFRIYAARDRGALRGYLVTLVVDEAAPARLRRLWFVDWLFAPRDARTIGEALLRAGLREAFSVRADLVGAQTSAGTPLPLPWKRFGFVRRSLYKPVIVHKSAAGTGFIERNDPWHYTVGDTDAF